MSTVAPVLVYGCDLASLMAVLRLADLGIACQFIMPVPVVNSLERGSTDGINVADQNQSGALESHLEDSLKVSHGLADAKTLVALTQFAPKILNYLLRAGLTVDRNIEGGIRRGLGPNATEARVVTAGEHTAHQILNILDSQLLRAEANGLVVVHSGWNFASVVLGDKKNLEGLVLQNRESMEFTILPCQNLILSDPGLGSSLFSESRHCDWAMGSVLADLYQKGLELADLEFYSSTLAGLPSESARVVDGLLGGVVTDADYQTKVPGLFAVGQACASRHGAGILEGNRILEHLYSGLRAAEAAFTRITQDQHTAIVQKDFADELLRLRQKQQAVLDFSGPENVFSLHQELTQVMQDFTVKRADHDSLNMALNVIHEIKERWLRIGLSDRTRFLNLELMAVLGLADLLTLAELVVLNSLMRMESRGAHLRTDFPSKNDARFLGHSLIQYHTNGPAINFVPVPLLSAFTDEKMADMGEG